MYSTRRSAACSPPHTDPAPNFHTIYERWFAGERCPATCRGCLGPNLGDNTTASTASSDPGGGTSALPEWTTALLLAIVLITAVICFTTGLWIKTRRQLRRERDRKRPNTGPRRGIDLPSIADDVSVDVCDLMWDHSNAIDSLPKAVGSADSSWAGYPLPGGHLTSAELPEFAPEARMATYREPRMQSERRGRPSTEHLDRVSAARTRAIPLDIGTMTGVADKPGLRAVGHADQLPSWLATARGCFKGRTVYLLDDSMVPVEDWVLSFYESKLAVPLGSAQSGTAESST